MIFFTLLTLLLCSCNMGESDSSVNENRRVKIHSVQNEVSSSSYELSPANQLFQGAWEPGVEYPKEALVFWEGSFYRALSANDKNPQLAKYWEQVGSFEGYPDLKDWEKSSSFSDASSSSIVDGPSPLDLDTAFTEHQIPKIAFFHFNPYCHRTFNCGEERELIWDIGEKAYFYFNFKKWQRLEAWGLEELLGGDFAWKIPYHYSDIELDHWWEWTYFLLKNFPLEIRIPKGELNFSFDKDFDFDQFDSLVFVGAGLESVVNLKVDRWEWRNVRFENLKINWLDSYYDFSMMDGVRFIDVAMYGEAVWYVVDLGLVCRNATFNNENLGWYCER